MKKIVLLLAVFATITIQVSATRHTITTTGSSTYSPALLTVHIGDTVTISASTFHPLVQVSKSTWNSNGTLALAGGWGPTTKNLTFTVVKADTIYYVCTAHAEFGMKGRLVVAQFTGINELPAENLSVSVYPNPVTSTATVRFTNSGKSAVTVNVFNITGQLEKDLTAALTQVNGDYYCEFDASRMTAGLHFVLVSDGLNKIVKRFEVIR
jgi:plastocyanin